MSSRLRCLQREAQESKTKPVDDNATSEFFADSTHRARLILIVFVFVLRGDIIIILYLYIYI